MKWSYALDCYSITMLNPDDEKTAEGRFAQPVIEHDRMLKSLTTFKIGGPARFFTEVSDPVMLPELLDAAKKEQMPVLILGGGSNMLVSDDGFPGFAIHLTNKGILIREEDETEADLWIGSGEVWDDAVKYAAEHGLWGIENLSRIPGQAGAVAVQNVGAYGQEIKDVLLQVVVYDREKRTFRNLSKTQCEFSYRKSIFNSTERERYVIISTTLRLSKVPKRNLSYPDVKKWFEGNPEPSILEIRAAIKAIRDKKFPFPAESIEGNAGSFFKNSVLTEQEYQSLEHSFEKNLPEHLERLKTIRSRSAGTEIKIPTAFILESCGLKGFQMGNVQLNPAQPVIVLNVTGNATAAEVMALVAEVRRIVKEKTGLHISIEPELIGF